MLKKNKSGFTIIEVLIVLAIAGLIMLIVFLAVPALQRNSRNTQYKNAAAAVLSTANEYVTNNNGSMPTTVAIATDGTITVSGTGTSATSKTQGGYTASVGITMPTDTGAFVLNINVKCNGNAFDSGTTKRAFAIGYLLETGSTTVSQCTGS